MYWADKFAEKIIKSGKYRPFWVDDMKTPSGRIHAGALRGVIIHELLFRAIKEKGERATYTYCFNDIDPMDAFPHYLPEKFRKYMGKPLFQIPSPEAGYPSMTRCYGEQFIEVFNRLGAKPRIIWSSEYYKQGKFNEVTKEALDKVDKIRELYKTISGYDKPKNWYPFQVICPKCGKVGTTITTGWDGEKVSFECRENLVDWAKGCGYKGKVSPFNGTGKLMWKVDWAAHWKVIGVTIEWSGKDHMSEGGSYDLSSAICEKVFNYPPPHAKLYEWFLAKGGTKMSSSKGIGVSAREISKTLPAEVLRFLLVRTHHRKAIIFDPNNNESILDLFDEYDQFADYYFNRRVKDDYGRIWQLSQIGEIPKTKAFLPRFRDVVKYIQMPSVDVYKKFEEIKGSRLTKKEKEILTERIKYARIWLKTYAPKEMVYEVSREIPKEAEKLSKEQKKYLISLIPLISQKDWQPEELQPELYNLAKKQKFSPKKAFQSIYLALIGKTHGPKAAWFLLENREKVLERLEEIIK